MKHEYLIAGAIIALFWWNTNGPQQAIPLPATDEATVMARYGTSTKRSLTTYVRQFERDLALLDRNLFYGPDLRP